MSDNEDSNHVLGGNTQSFEEAVQSEEDAIAQRNAYSVHNPSAAKRARVEKSQSTVPSRLVLKRDRGDLLIMGWVGGAFFSFSAPRTHVHVRVVEDVMLTILKITVAAERKKSTSMFLNAMKQRIIEAQPSTNACIFAVGAHAYSTLGLISKDDLKWWRTDAHKENDGKYPYVVYVFEN